MARTLTGARAIVTGASSGLGREIALELGRKRSHVVLVARREERLLEVAVEIVQWGGKAEIVAGDVTSPTIRQTAIDAAQAAFGGLDILINNAGVGAIGRFVDADEERMRRIMEINFFAPVELTRIALPLLQAGRNPIVVNIGSILGHRATPHDSEYCASKFALRGWSQTLQAELRLLGIDVLLVSPGSTRTEFWNNLLEQKGSVPWSRDGAMSAQRVAYNIVKAIRHGRRWELVPGLRSKFFVLSSRLFPRIVDRIMRRYA
ncbi:MAG: SDR family NAD(P)-dependent oxidoreductase [Pirellulales bacterium]|nr:SDR family NAD(P)-dependent oxidoreductase [Pirellulales bacterium]